MSEREEQEIRDFVRSLIMTGNRAQRCGFRWLSMTGEQAWCWHLVGHIGPHEWWRSRKEHRKRIRERSGPNAWVAVGYESSVRSWGEKGP